MNQDEMYMQVALEEAALAVEADDVPVGAVLVERATGRILARGHNTREACQDLLGHAELNVITTATQGREGYRLADCTLYVTLEPCPMCAGAILQARIPRVVCGAKDPVAGAMGSIWALHHHPQERCRTAVDYGCMENESRALLQQFFQKKRTRA